MVVRVKETMVGIKDAQFMDTRALVRAVIRLVGAKASPSQIAAAVSFAQRALAYRTRCLQNECGLVDSLAYWGREKR
jgi:hypothetical protein